MARFCNTCGREVEQRTRRGERAEGSASILAHRCELRQVADRSAIDLDTGARVVVERYVPNAPEPRLNRAARRASADPKRSTLHATVQRTAENGARLAHPSILTPVDSVARADRRAA